MDSDGNSQVSASKKWLALAELTCNWQLKRGNSRKFHGARGILMYLNITFMKGLPLGSVIDHLRSIDGVEASRMEVVFD